MRELRHRGLRRVTRVTCSWRGRRERPGKSDAAKIFDTATVRQEALVERGDRRRVRQQRRRALALPGGLFEPATAIGVHRRARSQTLGLRSTRSPERVLTEIGAHHRVRHVEGARDELVAPRRIVRSRRRRTRGGSSTRRRRGGLVLTRTAQEIVVDRVRTRALARRVFHLFDRCADEHGRNGRDPRRQMGRDTRERERRDHPKRRRWIRSSVRRRSRRSVRAQAGRRRETGPHRGRRETGPQRLRHGRRNAGPKGRRPKRSGRREKRRLGRARRQRRRRPPQRRGRRARQLSCDVMRGRRDVVGELNAFGQRVHLRRQLVVGIGKRRAHRRLLVRRLGALNVRRWGGSQRSER